MDTLEVEAADGVAVVRLNRPPVNAVNEVMMRELRRSFDALSQDRSLGAVVLAGCGDRAFCGGIELKEMASRTVDDGGDVRAFLDPFWEWRQAQYAIYQCSVSVIAAVERPAIGAGFGLVGSCDLVVAGESATFGLTEINVGVLGGASKALRLLDPSEARRMLFLGELLPAQELYRLGGVEEVVPTGEAETCAVGRARQMATKSPIALRLAKESILRIEADEMMQSYRIENDYTTRLGTFADAQEAVNAFVEKRPPTWTWS